MKRTMRTSMVLHHGITAGALREVLDSVPDEATITADRTPPDRPWDSEMFSLEFLWTEGER